MRHEIGHRVDASVGGPNYTKSDDGGGWQTWDTSAGMAQRLVTAAGGKISSWHDASEKAAIIACLQHVIADRAPTEINARLEALALPAETTVDGHPAVVYCLTSSARSIPVSVITAVVKPDFQVELHAQPVLED